MFKFISELIVLVAFFVGYQYGGIREATLYMLIASILSLMLTYIVDRKFHVSSIISTSILVVTAFFTLISNNSTFIKIKATILYMIFGFIFLISAARGKPFIKYALENSFNLKEKAWYSLSYRFGAFFLFMAIVNEIIWRNFSEGFWVKFKVFGALPVTILFIVIQFPFILKNQHNKEGQQ